MDIRVLDRNYNIVDMVQNAKSFIWTERFSGYGDFELVVPTQEIGRLFPDNHIYLKKSKYLMIVESYEKLEQDEFGADHIKVIGRSGESLLENRLVTPSRSTEPWTSNGNSPGAIATWLVRKICIDATGFSSLDRIENLDWESAVGSDILETDVEFTNSTTLYSAVKDLCDSANLGFRMHFDLATKMYTFRVFRGVDRTGFDVVTPLIFDASLETLFGAKYFKSISEHKNVAYVSHTDRVSNRIVYPRNTASTSGRRRKVLYVDASDIEEPTNAKLDQRGRQELAKHRILDLFDGEPEPDASMVYNVNYEIGDIGLVRDSEGNSSQVVVAEHTWTYDSDGLRSFPTFKTLED